MSTSAKEVRFLLHWLGDADTSALGECDGSALDVLMALGLATIDAANVGRDPLNARVSLTNLGIAVLTTLKRREPEAGA